MVVQSNKALLLRRATTERRLAIEVAADPTRDYMDRVRAIVRLGVSGDKSMIPFLNRIALNDQDGDIRGWAETFKTALERDNKFLYDGNSAAIFVSRRVHGLRADQTKKITETALDVGLSFVGMHDKPSPEVVAFMNQVRATPDYEDAKAQAEKDRIDFGEAPDPFNLTPKQVEIARRQCDQAVAVFTEVAKMGNGSLTGGSAYLTEFTEIMKTFQPGNRQSMIDCNVKLCRLYIKLYEKEKNHEADISESAALAVWKSGHKAEMEKPYAKEIFRETLTLLEPREIDLLSELLETDLRVELELK